MASFSEDLKLLPRYFPFILCWMFETQRPRFIWSREWLGTVMWKLHWLLCPDRYLPPEVSAKLSLSGYERAYRQVFGELDLLKDYSDEELKEACESAPEKYREKIFQELRAWFSS